jgi:hypothetical protein
LSHDFVPEFQFFQLLDAEDERVTSAVKSRGCPACGGRLDRADYPRKPRGGEVGVAGETFDRRRSLCCARDGCRRRRTPASLVFMGRRVYLAITVVLATWREAATASPPRRTVRRWRAWFGALRNTGWWFGQRGRLWPPIEPQESLPGAIVDRLLAKHPGAAGFLAVLRIVTSGSTG